MQNVLSRTLHGIAQSVYEHEGEACERYEERQREVVGRVGDDTHQKEPQPPTGVIISIDEALLVSPPSPRSVRAKMVGNMIASKK